MNKIEYVSSREEIVLRYLDENLLRADSLSFHPNDCRGTVVISQAMFARYLTEKGNTYRYMKLY